MTQPHVEYVADIVHGRYVDTAQFDTYWIRCSCGYVGLPNDTLGEAQEELRYHCETQHGGDTKTIDEWLELALDPIREQIEQSESGEELVFIGARLTEIEQKISSAFAEIRTLLNDRLSYVTGRVKGQG